MTTPRAVTAQGRRNGSWEHWSDTGYILKVESVGFADSCMKERKSRMTPSSLIRAKKKDKITFTETEKPATETDLKGKRRSSVQKQRACDA